mgnify:CR=1 FL=1
MKQFLLTDEEIQYIIERRKTIYGANQFILHEDYAEIILRDKNFVTQN